MNYIGSKAFLVDSFIDRAMKTQGIAPPGAFLDAFAGTHAVGRFMQRRGWTVHANDQMAYSALIGTTVLCVDSLGFTELEGDVFLARLPAEERLIEIIGHLNYEAECAPLEYDPQRHGGQWFLDKYCEGGADGRLYFSLENGKRICYLRHLISQWRLNYWEWSVLTYALLVAADRVANTASVYYAYLKKLKPSAQKSLRLRVPELGSGPRASVCRMDAVDFVKMASKDASVLYLDPPYNQRQYAPNYHLLETITLWDDPEAKGVSGIRPYGKQKSAWCNRGGAAAELTRILSVSETPVTMLSYSNEGILSKDEILAILDRFGATTAVHEQPHPRFKSRKGEAPRQVVEYLFVNRRR